MRCPYCAEEVKDEAVVCKHCHSELFVVKSLLEKINVLSARFAALGNTAEFLETEVAGHARRAAIHHHRPAITPLEAYTLTYIGLIIAHFLIIIVHPESKLIYLRFASMAIPFVFGMLCRESEKSTLVFELLGGMVVATAAILSMEAVVAYVDKTQWLPKDAYEWKEDAIYGSSIAFGFLTGVITRHMLIAIYSPSAKSNFVIEWIARFLVEQFGDGTGKSKFTLKSVRSMVSSVLGFGSAVISIVTGLWEFLK